MSPEPSETRYLDSPRTFNLKEICNATKLGPLLFTEVEEILDEMIKVITTLEDYDYQKTLKNPSNVLKIDEAKKQVNQFLQKIESFDVLATSSKALHQNLVTDIQRFHKSKFYDLVEPSLNILKSNKLLSSVDINKLQNKLKETEEKMKISFAKIDENNKEIEKELENIKKRKDDLQSNKLSIGTLALSKSFSDQYQEHQKNSSKWFWLSSLFYGIILLFIIYKIRTLPDASFSFSSPGDYINLAFELIIISSIFYGLSFLRKNYNIERNLELRNRNRMTLAETLSNFLESSAEIEFKKDMIAKGIPAIFSLDKTGYLDKDENSINPTHEVISNVIKTGLSNRSPN